MKRQIFFGTVLAAAMAVGLSAQSGTSQYGSQQSKSSNSVTVTGCLQPSSQASTGATGTTGTNPSSNTSNAQFMLTDVSMGSSSATSNPSSSSNPPSSASSSSATSSTAGTTGTDNNILLEGSNLSKHEGHKVQVKGQWADNSGSMTGSSASGTSSTGSSASGTSGMSSSSSASRTLRVSSVKDIASSCSGNLH